MEPRKSVSRKYTRGYFLLLIMLVVAMVLSLGTQSFLSRGYRTMVDNVTALNELFVRMDNTNRELTSYVIFLLDESREAYLSEAERLLAQVGLVEAQLDRSWSRDIADLCATVRTYLAQGKRLAEMPLTTDSGGAAVIDAARQVYAEAQETFSSIELNLKNVYSAKLTEIQDQQRRLESLVKGLVVGEALLLIAACMICVRYYHLILRNVKQSLDTLTAFARDVQERETIPVAHIQLDTDDEFTVFADTFNQMLDTIDEQFHRIEETSKIRERLQEAELENLRTSHVLQSTQMRLLQSRINPHFLFNTLNTILATAQLEGAEQTGKLIETTACFLRYNLDRLTHAVTLKDEMENARNYVTIQTCRFGEQFSFSFEEDPACDMLVMPCMILQPLIENALMHGVHDMERGGTVWIRSRSDDGRTLLEVEDNGAGFPPDTLAALRQRLSTKPLTEESTHLGLRNLYQRLMLYFEKDVGFTIESRPGRTCIRISLPAERRKAHDV